MRSKSPAQATGDVRALIKHKVQLLKRYQGPWISASELLQFIDDMPKRAKKAPGGVQRQKKGAK